jgi:hypothetical protein
MAMPRCSRNRSMSAIRCPVVLWRTSAIGSLACGVRRTAPAAALVEQDHPVAVRVEVAAGVDRAPRPWPAMAHERGLAIWIAADLPVHEVSVTDIEHPLLVRLYRRIKPRPDPFSPIVQQTAALSPCIATDAERRTPLPTPQCGTASGFPYSPESTPRGDRRLVSQTTDKWRLIPPTKPSRAPNWQQPSWRSAPWHAPAPAARICAPAPSTLAAGPDPDDPERLRGLCKRCHDAYTASSSPGGWSRAQ